MKGTGRGLGKMGAWFPESGQGNSVQHTLAKGNRLWVTALQADLPAKWREKLGQKYGLAHCAAARLANAKFLGPFSLTTKLFGACIFAEWIGMFCLLMPSYFDQTFDRVKQLAANFRDSQCEAEAAWGSANEIRIVQEEAK